MILLVATDIVRDGQDLGNSTVSQVLGIAVVALVIAVVAVIAWAVSTIGKRDKTIASLQEQRVKDAQAGAGHIARVLEDAVGIATLATEAVNRQPGHYREVLNTLEKYGEQSEELRKEIRETLTLIKYKRG